MALLLSVTYFIVSTSCIIAVYRARRKRKEPVVVPESNPDERSLKQQLSDCLQYGDTDTAERISLRLLALRGATDVRSD